MKSMNRSLIRGFAAALTVLAVSAAPSLAQDQGQAPKKPITPTVMKSFGGWDVRCYPVSTPAPCDMWEAIAFKKGGQLAVSVSIVYVPSQDRHLLQMIVPLDVDLIKGAKLISDTYTSEQLRYHHCDRIGCYVVVPDGNPVMDSLKSSTKLAVRVNQFHGKSIDLSVPLKGFSDAHAAMVELARQKAANPPAAQQPDATP